METPCMVCLKDAEPTKMVSLNCSHSFCYQCIKSHLKHLKDTRSLKPTNIICLQESCFEQIPDTVINKALPPVEAMIITMIRKKYQDSKDPYNLVFACQGLCSPNWKQLIPKTQQISREQHTRETLLLIKEIRLGMKSMETTDCSSIITIHKIKDVNRKDPLMCFKCGVSYCKKCFNLGHDGDCPSMKQQYIPKTNKNLQTNSNVDQFGQYLKASGMLQCLNKNCGIPIQRQAGCYFVKCFCGWQMCYPCKTLWGDCSHFPQYTYTKFIPPPEWMQKVLNRT